MASSTPPRILARHVLEDPRLRVLYVPSMNLMILLPSNESVVTRRRSTPVASGTPRHLSHKNARCCADVTESYVKERLGRSPQMLAYGCPALLDVPRTLRVVTMSFCDGILATVGKNDENHSTVLMLWKSSLQQMLVPIGAKTTKVSEEDKDDVVGCAWVRCTNDRRTIVVVSNECSEAYAIGHHNEPDDDDSDSDLFGDVRRSFTIDHKDRPSAVSACAGNRFTLAFTTGDIALFDARNGMKLLHWSCASSLVDGIMGIRCASTECVRVTSEGQSSSSPNSASSSLLWGLVLSDGSSGIFRSDTSKIELIRMNSSCAIALTSHRRSGTSRSFQNVVAAIGTVDGAVYLYSCSYKCAPRDYPEKARKRSAKEARWTLNRCLSLSHWYYEKDDVGAVRSLSWSSNGRALAAGYASRGLVVWSTSGCRLIRTIPAVKGSSSGDSDRSNNELCGSGVRSVVWNDSCALVVLPKKLRRGSVAIANETQRSSSGHDVLVYLSVLQMVKSSTYDNVGYRPPPVFLGENGLLVLSHHSVSTHLKSSRCGRRVWLQPDKMYLAEMFPLKIASISADGRRIAVAGRRGLSIWSQRTRKWTNFRSRSQERSIICESLCWWNNRAVFVAKRDTSHRVMLSALPYWRLDRSASLLSSDVYVPLSSHLTDSVVRMCATRNSLIVATVTEVVCFSLRSEGTWKTYDGTSRLFVAPRFVVRGSCAHVAHVLNGRVRTSLDTVDDRTSVRWFRRDSHLMDDQKSDERVLGGGTNERYEIVASQLTDSREDEDEAKELEDDGTSSWHMSWNVLPVSRSCGVWDATLWGVLDGRVHLHSIGHTQVGTSEIDATYSTADEWPLSAVIPTFDWNFLEPVIVTTSHTSNVPFFDFHIHSRSCLHVLMRAILSSSELARRALRFVHTYTSVGLGADENMRRALSRVIRDAAMKRESGLLRRLRKLVSALRCSSSEYCKFHFDSLCVDAAYNCDPTQWEFIFAQGMTESVIGFETYLRRIFTQVVTPGKCSRTLSDHRSLPSMETAVRCLTLLKRVRFEENVTLRQLAEPHSRPGTALYTQHADNMTLLEAALSCGDARTSCNTWIRLRRLESECASQGTMLFCIVEECISSTLVQRLISEPREHHHDVAVLTIWTACARLRDSTFKKPKRDPSSVSRSWESSTLLRVFSRLSRVERAIRENDLISKEFRDAIIPALEFAGCFQLSLLCAIVLRSTTTCRSYARRMLRMSRDVSIALSYGADHDDASTAARNFLMPILRSQESSSVTPLKEYVQQQLFRPSLLACSLHDVSHPTTYVSRSNCSLSQSHRRRSRYMHGRFVEETRARAYLAGVISGEHCELLGPLKGPSEGP